MGGGGITVLWVPLDCFEGQHENNPIQPHSVARNPLLTKQLFGYAILGFVLTKAIALFALMMAF